MKTKETPLWFASRIVFALLVQLCIGSHPAQAEVTETWVRQYRHVENDAFDSAARVVRDADDDIVVTGTSAKRFVGAQGSNRIPGR